MIEHSIDLGHQRLKYSLSKLSSERKDKRKNHQIEGFSSEYPLTSTNSFPIVGLHPLAGIVLPNLGSG